MHGTRGVGLRHRCCGRKDQRRSIGTAGDQLTLCVDRIFTKVDTYGLVVEGVGLHAPIARPGQLSAKGVSTHAGALANLLEHYGWLGAQAGVDVRLKTWEPTGNGALAGEL